MTRIELGSVHDKDIGRNVDDWAIVSVSALIWRECHCNMLDRSSEIKLVL